MKSNLNLPICPACGEPMTPDHHLLLLIPIVVWDGEKFVRDYRHPSGAELN